MLADDKQVVYLQSEKIKWLLILYYDNVYCPECGCEDVTIYDDGYCECNGCGFEWQEFYEE